MEIQPVKNESSYRAALAAIEGLMMAKRDTPEGDRLDVLVTLVQAYEAKHHPIDPPDPIEAIKFRMDQSGMGVKDLVPFIGPLNRVYEVLARKRPLTLHMIRRLNKGMGIPADVLIGLAEEEALAD
ncbi:HTH-type transcriptional regulator / antitoxin HigA [Variovorax sp. PDC80]|jgi:HTH-type transcriptional regulator/antitoxin HigA|uniref:helix-turn-helix domain-containing protein n=1 Tax=Variovorax TaxID=34072 RepID=UPI0008E897DA|nr:transcriptional regulator [Variovorax sp. PDC80]QRF62138.1 transcriptional regulator [Variovorax paradoxus]SFO81816.1 HTH-type transcriptional regulator / antitoxin HigA [Variovorax sp. PDC80]